MNNHTNNSILLLEKTLQKLNGAYAPSTIRAYRANFSKFIRFCDNSNSQALPASSATVAQFISELTCGSLKSSSIRLAVAAISSIHKFNLLDDPTKHPVAKIELRRTHRTLGRYSQQAFGITEEILEKMLEATSNNLRGIRDKALLLLAYDSMCRRNELVSLKLLDITSNDTNDQAKIKIRLRRSKTDQELQGKWIFPSQRSAIAIQLWINEARLTDGFLFRGITNNLSVTSELKCGQINRIYKTLAKNANLPQKIIKHISGHSMRVGAAQDLLKKGANLTLIMNRGRWSKSDTVMRYLEEFNPTY